MPMQLPIDYACMVVSERTHKPKDIVENMNNFLKALENYFPIFLLHEWNILYQEFIWAAVQENKDIILWEDMFDFFEKIAPIGYYFGVHDGDGSCYGFWKCSDEGYDDEN